MGWHMKFVICVQLAYVSMCLTQLSVVREWTSLDLQLPPEDGQESRRSIMPSDIISLSMYKDRLFVTFNYEGFPYSLAYLDLTDNSTSPLLRPYPIWEAHVGNENQRILNAFIQVRVDRCDRLWMWVISFMPVNGDFDVKKYMIVIDLKTDSILRKSSFPSLVTYSLDIAVDDFDCDNEYVYISSFDGVWTYSWAEDDLWHRYNASVIYDHIDSMILAPNSIIYYTLYGEPTVYYMSTTHLRDKSKTSDIREHNGRSRKLNINLAASVLDAKSDVLYYINNNNNTVIHAFPCWTSERCSSNGQGDIDVGFDPTHRLNYITVDENGDLWAITSTSRFKRRNFSGEINFRLLSIPVTSTCVELNANDTTNTNTGVESNAKDTTNTSTCVESNIKDTTNTSTGVESNTKDTTNTTNINEITTAESSATEQTSTLGSVHKNTTVNIADTTAGTPNSNISQAVGGTN